MLPSSGKKKLATACLKFAHNASDKDGRVDIVRLCEEFSAELISRPMLVEGMIGKRKESEGNWTVLINSEIYPSEIFAQERHPNAKRLRNTIAHELLHTLGFRLEEFEVKLTKKKSSSQSTKNFLRSIEGETGKLSPLLLLPTKSLKNLLSCKNVSEYSNFCDEYGVSRYVLIQRLNLLSLTQEEISKDHFRNLAIGICNRDLFKEWPLFFNFDNNIIPSFIFEVLEKVPTKVSSVFPNHPTDKEKLVSELKVAAGTFQNRNTESLELRFFLESTNSSERLFLLRN